MADSETRRRERRWKASGDAWEGLEQWVFAVAGWGREPLVQTRALIPWALETHAA